MTRKITALAAVGRRRRARRLRQRGRQAGRRRQGRGRQGQRRAGRARQARGRDVPADAREQGLQASFSNAATVAEDKQVVGLFVVKDAELAGDVSEQVRKSAPKAAKLIVDGNVLVVYAPAGGRPFRGGRAGRQGAVRTDMKRTLKRHSDGAGRLSGARAGLGRDGRCRRADHGQAGQGLVPHGRDVKDRSLTAADFEGSVTGPGPARPARRASRGVPGPTGPGGTGPAGPAGTIGPAGPAGPPGLSGYEIRIQRQDIPGRDYRSWQVRCTGDKKAFGGGVSGNFMTDVGRAPRPTTGSAGPRPPYNSSPADYSAYVWVICANAS